MQINLKSRTTPKQSLKVQAIPIHQIKIKPQVRQDIDEDFESPEMKQLVDSIESNGLLNPITLRRETDGSLVLVAGHRRLNACKKLGYETVFATVPEITEEEASFIQLTENITRKDLRFYDISAQIAKIAKLTNPSTKKHFTQKEIAKRLGMDQADISRHLSLSKADSGILHLCKQGKLTSLRAACALMDLYRVSYPSAQKLIRMDRLTLDAINHEIRSVKDILIKESQNDDQGLLKSEQQPAMNFDDPSEAKVAAVSPERMKGMLEADPIYQSQAEKDNHKYALQSTQPKNNDIEALDDEEVSLAVVTLDDMDEDDVPTIASIDNVEEADTSTQTEAFNENQISSNLGFPIRFIKVSVIQANGEKLVGELNFDEDSTFNRKSGQTYVQVILENGSTTMANVNNIKILEIGDRM